MIDQAKNLREIARNRVENSGAAESLDISNAQRRIKRGMCRSISIISGKGGVGKSNIAVSVAIALTRLKKKVLLFDGDFGLANIHILLGIAPKYNLSHVVKGECTLEETLCKGSGDITIIPGSSGIMSMANLELLSLESLIRVLSRLEEKYDFLLIDGGAGIAETSIQICSVADSALLIITPDPASLADAYSTVKIIFSKGIEEIRVFVNMADTEKTGIETFERLYNLTKKFLNKELILSGVLPFNKNIQKYIRTQKNVLIEKPSDIFSLKIQNYARKICGMQSIKPLGFFARLFSSQLNEKKEVL